MMVCPVIKRDLFINSNRSNRIIFLIFCSITVVNVYYQTTNRVKVVWRNPYTKVFYPSLILPSNATFAEFPILDFVLIYDPSTDELASLFLSGYRHSLEWNSIDCYFIQSNITTKCVIEQQLAEPSITCPLPPLEQKALKNKQPYIFVSLTLQNQSGEADSEFQTSIIKVPVYHRRKFNISIYTMIKNKNYELIEWIEYHLLIGIEHFYLYNNLGDDHVEIFLRAYLARGLVTIIQWPFLPLPNHHWNMIQSASMNHMLKNFGSFNRWVGYFDVDEYFVISDPLIGVSLNGSHSLPELLDEKFPVEQYSGGVQFENCPMSCSMRQEDILISRYKLLLEKCQIFSKPTACQSRFKLFIRPKYVPLMQDIHRLSIGVYAAAHLTKSFGRFLHFHYGSIRSSSVRDKKLRHSLKPYIDKLRSRVIPLLVKE